MSVQTIDNVVSCDPEVLGGTPVFAGTRVPVRSLFDHLTAGDGIDDFLEGFPSVKREQVESLLNRTHDLLLETLQHAHLA